MISTETLQAVTDIIVHDHCPDGMMSAIVLHDVLPNAIIHFMQYGEAHANLEPKPGMMFCDFSPHPERAHEFADVGTIVLDHHKTARAVVERHGSNGVFGDEVTEPGVCGATLAFREVWCRLKPYDDHSSDRVADASYLINLSGVRDTWQRKSVFWNEALLLAEVLRFLPADLWLNVKDPFHHGKWRWWQERMDLGRILVSKHQTKVQAMVDASYAFTSGDGVRVRMFPGNSATTSDAAELLGSNTDLVVGFSYIGIEDGLAKLLFSTRSHTDFDCAKFCTSMGGGGHTKAAGFRVVFSPDVGSQDPYSVLRASLSGYESSNKGR
jgi:hypothetical protein